MAKKPQIQTPNDLIGDSALSIPETGIVTGPRIPESVLAAEKKALENLAQNMTQSMPKDESTQGSPAFIGKNVLFYKGPQNEGEPLVAVPAIILELKNGSATLQLNCGSYVEKITRIAYSLVPTAGFWNDTYT